MGETVLTSNIVRNIVIEVMRECKNHKIRASPGFVSYYVNLLQLDPNRGLTLDCITNREKVQRFVKYVVAMLGSKDDPKMLTLRLQHEFRNYIKELDKVVQQYRRRLNNKLYPLLLDIVEQDRRNTGEQLYTKICYYVILASGMGNPTHKLVFKETLQVLKSVLDPEEISIFPSLQNFIKQELLGSVVDIITGIRLYNKACKKGGEGMDDLPTLLKDAIAAVDVELTKCIQESTQRARILTRSAEKSILIIRRKNDDWDILLNINSLEENKHWELRRDLAAAHRQLSKTTRILLESVKNLDAHRKILHEGFKETIEHLNKIVVPTLYQGVTIVFPHFTHLSQIWKELQDDAVRLKEIFDIFDIQARQIFCIDFEVYVGNESTPFQSWVQSEDEELTKVTTRDLKVHVDTTNFTKKHLEFNGYCIWILVNANGLLLPANIELGVVEYKKLFYGFSSNMAANSFIRDPERYILFVIELARKWVYLIKLLNVERRLMEYVHVKVLIQKKEEQKIAVSTQEVQTDLHFQESNIDYNYCWNIWDYKRAALLQKSLKTKQTTSCYTDKNYEKDSNHTQTHEMQDSETQTKCDNYGNTMRPLRYIYGLKGLRETHPVMLDLTDPLSCNQAPKQVLDGNKK